MRNETLAALLKISTTDIDNLLDNLLEGRLKGNFDRQVRV